MCFLEDLQFQIANLSRRKTKLFVKAIFSGKVFTLYAEGSSTIEQCKQMVQDIDGSPPDQQRLSIRGRILQDRKTLADYEIQDGSTILLTYELWADELFSVELYKLV
eukprot:TRINITY_DN2038_c0_g2_i1.p1 TRINITY_DN2038_c0_g2~~TRINITY_DN2038_c0_g2_i1.p1  ORF type:complete len:107 (-),score=14.01 TRINITY_DN2038_c0_g2_i1:4-324(-)